jgi:hypothetical protein
VPLRGFFLRSPQTVQQRLQNTLLNSIVSTRSSRPAVRHGGKPTVHRLRWNPLSPSPTLGNSTRQQLSCSRRFSWQHASSNSTHTSAMKLLHAPKREASGIAATDVDLRATSSGDGPEFLPGGPLTHWTFEFSACISRTSPLGGRSVGECLDGPRAMPLPDPRSAGAHRQRPRALVGG